MRKTNKIAFLLAVFTLSAATTAKAEIVEIAITATVNYVSDSGNYLEGKITNGSIITGSYKYESTTADSSPSDPTQGNYWHYVSPYGVLLTVGGFDFRTDFDNVNFLVSIGNNASGQDNYLLRSYDNSSLSNGTPVYHISWQLDDYTATAFSSDVLPITAPILSQWQSNELRLEGDKTFLIRAEVTDAVVIPEPTTILLLGLGIVFLKRRN